MLQSKDVFTFVRLSILVDFLANAMRKAVVPVSNVLRTTSFGESSTSFLLAFEHITLVDVAIMEGLSSTAVRKPLNPGAVVFLTIVHDHDALAMSLSEVEFSDVFITICLDQLASAMWTSIFLVTCINVTACRPDFSLDCRFCHSYLFRLCVDF